MSTWRVDIYDRNSTIQLSDLNYQNMRVTWTLNGPGSFEAEMVLTDTHATRTNLDPGAHEIRVYRDNVLVWGGVLWRVEVDAESYRMRLFGEGYFSWLRHRIVEDDTVKTDVDQADIAWDLINYSQATHGTFNFTDGHVDTGITTDRVYCALDYNVVGDAITELSEMDDSFDFWITPTILDSTNKVFKTPTPSGGKALRGSTKAVTLDQDNSQTLNWTLDATTIANRLWGTGTGDCNPPTKEVNDATSITSYGELHDVAEFDDLNSLNSVEAHTREELRMRKNPQLQAVVKVFEADITWGSFDVGDIITLSSNRGYINESRSMRCVSFSVDVSGPNTVFYTADLDSVVS